MTPQTPEGLQKAWMLMSMHNSELLLENAELRRRLEAHLLHRSLWYRLKRATYILMGGNT